jgi:hypothetical protein
MDGKVIPFPKRPGTRDRVLYLQAKRQSTIIDLVEQRRQILRMQEEIRRMKKRLMKVVDNAGNEGTDKK